MLFDSVEGISRRRSRSQSFAFGAAHRASEAGRAKDTAVALINGRLGRRPWRPGLGARTGNGAAKA